MWRGCSRRCRPEIGYELICASRGRRRGWISGPACDDSTDRFHAMVAWEAGDGPRASAESRDAQPPPPPFSQRAPQFAPTPTGDRGDTGAAILSLGKR
jgi:hypothetical protein